MADKTAWGVEDDSESYFYLLPLCVLILFLVPIWDGTEFYKFGRSVQNKKGFIWSDLQKLPRKKTDLSFGDIALIFYIPSLYTNRHGQPSLSLNLCGVALLAQVCLFMSSHYLVTHIYT